MRMLNGSNGGKKHATLDRRLAALEAKPGISSDLFIIVRWVLQSDGGCCQTNMARSGGETYRRCNDEDQGAFVARINSAVKERRTPGQTSAVVVITDTVDGEPARS